MKDIYFEQEYVEINKLIENGTSESFILNSIHGKVIHRFIKREIHDRLDDKMHYDITTPYGYGGPLIVNYTDKKKLLTEFKEDFQRYCIDNNIISEFVRFHPLENNALDFKEMYKTEFSRYTVGTNLKAFEDPVQEEFSKSCRKVIRKVLKNDITYRVEKSPKDITDFTKFYYSTMDRNSAGDFYYFSEEYFKKMHSAFPNNIVTTSVFFEGTKIAMGFYFIYEDRIHIHLSGTDSEFLYLSPAYILKYAITIWGKENGYSMIHHGGGRNSSVEDNLYKFKKKFGVNTSFEFYTGKKIWDVEKYNQLTIITGAEDSEFFPAYRSRK